VENSVFILKWKDCINSRLCELYLKNKLCLSILHHFNVDNCEFMTYVEGEVVYGYVIEPMMTGQTLNSYLKSRIEKIKLETNACKKSKMINALDKEMVNIMLVILQILEYLEKQLHFHHNDFHDSNIFVAEGEPCFIINGRHITLPFTLKIFDFDWSVIGDSPHELFILKMYEFVSLCKPDTNDLIQCIGNNLVCNQEAIDQNTFTIKKDCEFFAQHWKWGKLKNALVILQGSTTLSEVKSNVDLVRIMLYIIQNFTEDGIEITRDFPLFCDFYGFCNDRNFNIEKIQAESKVQQQASQESDGMSISYNNSQCTDYMSISCPNSQAAELSSPYFVGGRHQATNRNRAKKSSKRRC
jgi:hypothetical protein